MAKRPRLPNQRWPDGSVLIVADQDVRPVRGQRASDVPPTMVPGDVEDDVVALVASGEVLLRVVDDPVGADRPDRVELPGSVHARHVRPVRLRELHRERSHGATRAVDQDLLSGLDPSLVSDGLHRRAIRTSGRQRPLRTSSRRASVRTSPPKRPRTRRRRRRCATGWRRGSARRPHHPVGTESRSCRPTRRPRPDPCLERLSFGARNPAPMILRT